MAAAIYAVGVGGRGGNSESASGGGDGGNGGLGGEVTVVNQADVTVNMALPYGGAGIYAGGIAGNGGHQDNTAGDQDGGDGNDGRYIRVTNDADVYVNAPGSSGFVWGIAAEGIGGAGGDANGNGGVGVTPYVDGSGVKQATVESSGTVTVNAETTSVFDRGVRGIYAASIGGPGHIQDTSDKSDNGGYGHNGREALVTVSGDVSVTSNSVSAPSDGFDPTDTPTADLDAVGALEQSGGVVVYSRGGDGGAGPQAIDLGDGRTGGAGGNASSTSSSPGYDTNNPGMSQIYVEDGARITTQGSYIPGLVLYSIGGIGGVGREDSSGGDGGFGGNVKLRMTDESSVSTTGAHSHGVVVRTQGGPGGDFKPSSGFADFSPGYAGNGGSGGTVDLAFGLEFSNNVAVFSGYQTISTGGDDANGIVAQSFGSSGGSTGDSFELLGQTGASTGYGGNGGGVLGDFGVSISTQGSHARGILLQSVGDNGGAGGVSSGIFVIGGAGGAGGAGEPVEAQIVGDISTRGDGAAGVLGQSIGGGGGTGDSATGAAAIGGQGGSGGGAGYVKLFPLFGSVTTEGDFAYGVVAQSVGGGGGDGGSAFDLSAGSVPATGVGGSGGVGGDGAYALVTNIPAPGADLSGLPDMDPLQVATSGDNAHALIAQSVGGGGGMGGDADGGGVSLESFQMAGGAESGGSGWGVEIDLADGTVATSGSHAIGLLAQSVGGGGGTGGSAYSFDASLGFSLSVGVGGLGGDGGPGGEAVVSLDGTTVATGSDDATDSHGIVLQSIGGGGGSGGSSVAKAIAKAVSVPETDASVGFAASAAVGGAGGSGAPAAARASR